MFRVLSARRALVVYRTCPVRSLIEIYLSYVAYDALFGYVILEISVLFCNCLLRCIEVCYVSSTIC